jgi:hypothetical protein
MPASHAAQRCTDAAKAAFLRALSFGLSVTAACRKAKLPRRTAYLHREQDEEFAAAWEDALEQGTDGLEDEALRRGSKGWLEPRFYQGEKCGSVRKFSDTLLLATLRKRRPEWRERQEHEHKGRLSVELFVAALERGRKAAEAAAEAAPGEGEGYPIRPLGE